MTPSQILEEAKAHFSVGYRKLFLSDVIKFCEEKYPAQKDEVVSFFLTKKSNLKKIDKEYQSKIIKKSIVFKAEEYVTIEKKLRELQIDFSTFAKSALLKHKIKLPIQRELLFEINKIGNNLNQIAKAVNSRSDRISILTQLVEIEKALKEIK